MKEPNFNEFYQRQIILDEVRKEGQEALHKAAVVIIGCGGLGSTAAVYLAASGIGNIHLIDFDLVSISNLHRQVFYGLNDVGKPKVQCLKNHIESIAPFVTVNTTETTINKYNIYDHIKLADIVVDCTDNLHIKYLLNDSCVLNDKPLVYGSLHKFDGYIASFNYDLGDGTRTSNLRDAFPEIPEKIPPTCAEMGTLNPIVGIVALHQTNEVLKIILKKGNLLTNKLFIYNSLHHTTQNIQIKKQILKDEIASIFEKESYLPQNCDIKKNIIFLNKEEFWEKIQQDNIVIISFSGNLPQKKHSDKLIRLRYFNFDPFRMPVKFDYEYVLICEKGLMSYDAALAFVEAHPSLKVYHLANGIESLINN